MPPKLKRDRTSGGAACGVSAYMDPRTPWSLGGIERYACAQCITQKEALEELRGQLAYTLHRTVRRRFPTLPVLVFHIDDQWV